MKGQAFTIILLFVLSITVLNCDKVFDIFPANSKSFEREWGEISNGLRCSIQVDETNLSRGEPALVDILIENVSDHAIEFESIVGFNLYDDQNLWRYGAVFGIIKFDAALVWHPTSMIVLDNGSQFNQTVDISQLGWTQPIESRPPQTTFYDLIEPGQYTLRLEIEIIAGEVENNWIYSNGVLVVIG